MKEKKNRRSAAVMLACTVVIVAGGAVGLHAAMQHLQREQLAAESSGFTSGQNADEEPILLSAASQTDADEEPVLLSAASQTDADDARQDGQSDQKEQVEQEQKERKEENTKDTTVMTDNREKYISRSRGAYADSTADKLYFHALSSQNRLYCFDLKTGQFGHFCGIDGCRHDTIKCNAYFSTELIMDTLQVIDDKVYVFRRSAYRKTPYLNATLYRMDLDGSNREEVTMFRADATLRNARIIDGTIYAECEMDGTPDFRIFKQSLYGNEQAQEIFPAGYKDWKYRHIEIEAAVGDKLYFKASRYKGDIISEENAHWERTLWEYDTKSGQYTELLNSENGNWNNDFSFFIADGYLYFDFFDNTWSYPYNIYYPVSRLELASGKELYFNKFTPGRLEGYDGTYCYISTYDGIKEKSIEVYTLDGKHIQSIAVPAISDASDEYMFEISCVGCTYDAIVMHAGRYKDTDGKGDYYEDIYVYDKKQIGQADGTWAQFSLHDSLDSNGREVKHETKQK